ncbi:Proteasome subunit beta type-3 [Castilleja foliolosa]|uniref:Proteasome subunit beta type-3 n=1 Tax=Castilleja foliolosa TaxID=1961234 RepID=A0ABD3BZG2_9LAMI
MDGGVGVGVGNDGQPFIYGEPGPLQPSQPKTSVQPIRTRCARKPTRMAKLTLRYPGKVKIQFDSRWLMAVGPKKKIIDNFGSYLGFLGRKQPSILIQSWKRVSTNTKELIWQAILEKFEIFFVDSEKEVEFSLVDKKLQDMFRRKWVNYVGRRWAVFKTNLTSTYIYGKKKSDPPYVKEYEFLDKETWDAFVALRLTEEENAKRLRAQQIQSNNKCPQRCSRGGYGVLTQKIIDEKYKARKEALEDPSAIIQPPSPPSRHEAWKRARINLSGEYINQETSVIAEKIDALEQEASYGSFTPTGRNDILVVAIGKPDHPSRVRGVGTGYTVRTYFGKQGYSADGMVSREEVAVIVAELKAQMQTEMGAEMRAE